MPRSFEGDLNAEGLRIAVIASRFNDEIVSGLLDGALDCLRRHGVPDLHGFGQHHPEGEDVRPAVEVGRDRLPFELPTLAAKLDGFDAIVALGCLLRGDTPHFDFISQQVTLELSRVGVDRRLPVAFGVITCNTHEQAVQRSSVGAGNKGWEAALAAIEMANLWRVLRTEEQH